MKHRSIRRENSELKSLEWAYQKALNAYIRELRRIVMLIQYLDRSSINDVVKQQKLEGVRLSGLAKPKPPLGASPVVGTRG